MYVAFNHFIHSAFFYIFDFTGSPEPRTPRAHQVKFRIGQIIKHKKFGYRGVIIGWDPVARVSIT